MNFFRMHRQFVNADSGVTCDVALITQDISDIHRQIRYVVEETYRMTKLTVVGLSNRYRVDVYSRYKIVKTPLRSYQRTYESKYFPLYSSHSQKSADSANAREVNIDKRGNILGGKLFIFVLPALLLLSIFALYKAWAFFHPAAKPKETINNAQAGAVPVASSSLPQTPNGQSTSKFSTWKMHGFYTVKGIVTVVLVDESGAYRFVHNPDFAISGLDQKVYVDGQPANNWLLRQNVKSEFAR
jgi:zona occludens toxin